jgi:3-hydroxyisobutyrate dehydrogenase-like beta-hydroxyacid dehydrogenase
MVEGMLRRGDAVTVWNRTPAKAAALERLGARVAATPAEAVSSAARIHLTLSDDAAVDGMLSQVIAALSPGAVVIDHTTTAPAGTIVRYTRMQAFGVRFLHAPVFMSPDMARQSQGVLMSSGPQAIYDSVRDPLAQMTGEAWYLGHDPARAAAYKLFGNSMFFVITAGLADVFAMAQHQGLSRTDAMEVFSKFNAGGAIKFRGEKMARADYTATFELTMARKDLRLMIESAGDQPLVVLPALARRMDEAIAGGYGSEDMGAILKVVDAAKA